MKRGKGRKEEEMSLDRLICEPDPGTNVAQLQTTSNTRPWTMTFTKSGSWFPGMNLHNLVQEFEMETGSGSELNLPP